MNRAIDEAKGLVEIVDLAIKVTTDDELRNELVKHWNELRKWVKDHTGQQIAEEAWKKISDMATKAIDDKVSTYQKGGIDAEYQAGRDLVDLALIMCMWQWRKILTKPGKEFVKDAKDVIDAVKKGKGRLMNYLTKGMKPKLKDKLAKKLKDTGVNDFADLPPHSRKKFQRFIDDLEDVNDKDSKLLKAMNDNPELVDAWEVLDDAGVDDALRKNADKLKNADKYMKASGDSPDGLKQILKDAEPENQGKWLDALEDIDFKVNTKVTGTFETKELKQALKFGKEQGGGSLDFPNSAAGIEGVLKKTSGENIPISLKQVTPSDVKNITREIKDNAKKIREVFADPNAPNSELLKRYAKFDGDVNTHINVNVESAFTKSDFLNYYNSIPADRRKLLFGPAGTFKEIKITMGQETIKFNSLYELVD